MTPSETSNARSRRTREALLSASRALLEEQGSDKITMAAVAERAGVSRRAVYLHFESRTALINALFDYVNEVEDLAGGLAAVYQATGSVELLRRYARFLVTDVPRILPVSRAIRHASPSDPDAAAHWKIAMDFRRRHAADLVRQIGDDLAGPWSAVDAEGMLLALMSNDVIDTMLTDCGWSVDRAADRLGLLLCRTFLTDAG